MRIYQKALLELEHAKMRGRIGNARAAIKARIEKLREIPSLRLPSSEVGITIRDVPPAATG